MDVKTVFESLKRLPYWARIVVLVGVAAVLFALTFASCAASSKVQKSGVHIDTIRVDYIIKSNNYKKVVE